MAGKLIKSFKHLNGRNLSDACNKHVTCHFRVLVFGEGGMINDNSFVSM